MNWIADTWSNGGLSELKNESAAWQKEKATRVIESTALKFGDHSLFGMLKCSNIICPLFDEAVQLFIFPFLMRHFLNTPRIF